MPEVYPGIPFSSGVAPSVSLFTPSTSFGACAFSWAIPSAKVWVPPARVREPLARVPAPFARRCDPSASVLAALPSFCPCVDSCPSPSTSFPEFSAALDAPSASWEPA